MNKRLIFIWIAIFVLTSIIGIRSQSVNAQTTPVQSYSFNNDLTLGSSGPDVVQLQTWLMNNGYNIPSLASSTVQPGYFGSQTQSALMLYQRSIGLPAYGFFGPMTRGYFNKGGCNGNDNNSCNTAFRITSPNGGENINIGQTYNITWNSTGINSSAKLSIFLDNDSIHCPVGIVGCWSSFDIDNGNGVNNTGNYSWDTSKKMFGDGGPNSVPVTPGSEYKIKICTYGTNTCDESDNYFNISSTVQNSQSPVISGIDAPTTLTTGQTGTWTVHATDPLNGTLSYSVQWGDEFHTCPTGYDCNASSPLILQSYGQISTFTHSYGSAGTYTITFTVRNQTGQSAQTSSTVTVNSSNTAGPLKITSPNGGEIWQKGTTQSITWTSPYYFAASTVDLILVQYQQPCTTPACPGGVLMPRYKIVSGVQANQNSYSWVVGNNVGGALPISLSPTYYSSTQTVPDGQYTIEICQSGTSNCDSSDAPFTITSNPISNLPDINIISPNGGEVWQAGQTYTVTVNITGDPSKIGDYVNASLAGPNNNNQSGVYIGGLSNSSSLILTPGTKSFQVTIPPTQYPGSYKMYVQLYGLQSQMTNCSLPAGDTGCDAPILQAYDYSDNYFTVTSGSQSYITPSTPDLSQCPIGYTCTLNSR